MPRHQAGVIAGSVAVLIVSVLLLPGDVTAQQVTGPKRIALVIGNSDYEDGRLVNPGRDADALATALVELQFDVIKRKDRTKQQLENDIDEVTANLKDGDLCLIFYAGHGYQIENENYIVPVGAEITRAHHVPHRCVSLQYILDALDDTDCSLRMVLLDCCRNNPFPQVSRGGNRGLARLDAAPEGTIISFSAPPGQVALDGEGENSSYTSNLLDVLSRERPGGLEVVDLFRVTSQAVQAQTGQTPYLEFDASMPKFFLKRPSASGSMTNVGETLNALKEKITGDREQFAKSIEGLEREQAESLYEIFAEDLRLDLEECIRLAEENPAHASAFDALLLVLQHIGVTRDAELLNKVIDEIKTNHVRDKRLIGLIGNLGEFHSTCSKELLSLASRRSPHKEVRAEATWELVKLLMANRDHQLMSEELEIFSESDGDERRKLLEDGRIELGTLERLVQTLIDRYGDLECEEQGEETYGGLATRAQYAIKYLSVGSKVPEVSGKDIDGVEFKLSDYRGKVVVLDFWGDW